MTPTQTYYQNLADTLIKNLQKRQIEAHYCPTSAEAVALADSMVLPNSTVSFGGSMTLSESGMLKVLTARTDITLYDRSTAKTRRSNRYLPQGVKRRFLLHEHQRHLCHWRTGKY